MIVDLLFWTICCLFGMGYVEFPSFVGSRWAAMDFLAELSNVIHAPVSWLFGPHLFRHMTADVAPTMGTIALGAYVLLCLAWSFAIGFGIAKVMQRRREKGERRRHPA